MEKLPIFLKWAGGKRKLLDKLSVLFPLKINRYFEPFLGAGSVLFFIRKKYKTKYCMVSDINRDLIDTYIAVRDNPQKLIRLIDYFKGKNSVKFYYKIRVDFNAKKIKGLKRAAAFIYLNKTCFNGLYRVNSKNQFNVPYGCYTNPEIYNREIILYASQLLQEVIIKHQDYRKILSKVRRGDFVYLDPCYDPIKPQKSFVHYTPHIFQETDRLELHDFVVSLRKRGVNFILNNNDLPKIHHIYKGFKIDTIESNRIIGGAVKNRGKVKELLISHIIK